MSKELVKKQHYHIGILGQSGGGKTQWTKEFLRDKRNSSIIILCSDISIGQWEDEKKAMPHIKLVTDDYKEIFKLCSKLKQYQRQHSKKPHEMGCTYIVIDDYMPILKTLNHNILSKFELIAKAGRHLGIHIVGLVQDAVDFPKFMRTQITDVVLMKDIDGETFTQLMEMMRVKEFGSKLWRGLQKQEKYTAMVLEKGSNAPVYEKVGDHGISVINETNVDVSGDNNSVVTNVMNLNGQSSLDARKQEIHDNRVIMFEQRKNTELSKVLKAVIDLEDYINGVLLDHRVRVVAIQNANILRRFLTTIGAKTISLTDKNYLNVIGYMLVRFKQYEIQEYKSKDSLMKYASAIKEAVSTRKKNIKRDEVSTLMVRGNIKKAALVASGNSIGINKIFGTSISDVYEFGKGLGLL